MTCAAETIWYFARACFDLCRQFKVRSVGEDVGNGKIEDKGHVLDEEGRGTRKFFPVQNSLQKRVLSALCFDVCLELPILR